MNLEHGERLREEVDELNYSEVTQHMADSVGGIAIQNADIHNVQEETAPRKPISERDLVDIRTGVYETEASIKSKDLTPEGVERAAGNRLKNHRLLKHKEEIALAKAIERGDLDAKEKLINHNTKLIYGPARNFLNEKTTHDDLIQMGTLGLIRAAEKYDWRKGFRFSTYAMIWIRQALQRESNNLNEIIRIPANHAPKIRKIKKFQDRFIQENPGEYPTYDQIAERLDLDAEEVDELLAMAEVVASTDQAVSDENGTTLGEFALSNEPDPSHEAVRSEVKQRVWDAIKALPEREAMLVTAKYGLDGEPIAVSVIADELDITASRAYQLLENAEKKISHRLRDLRTTAE